MTGSIFFQGWSGPVRILIVGVLSYAALVLLLRLTGKRTLSKLNAFDLVITVALGSTLSTAILDRNTPLLDGLVAMGLLVLLQFAVTWTMVRRPGLHRLIRADPVLLMAGGALRPDTLRRERISDDEVLQAIRDSGGRTLADADAVFLQSDGSMAVIQREG
ncbi:MAG: DUF421 domain-containing protein [Alphaproteobacteria bacterium]|jgi:uncharacterized membrane protein YcaP (DUF421 family)|nr:DUF421 domain-containing protein [Alphaproteobacteria bacterium]MBU2041926.1 DUF421 domain-containing protein [Alphaproteobacteria bacterium]MBU2124630.1 DUF421 domain-containing protein [Alphaproteobacteria bacterium]MBU2207423.1 DUF421 domain-containing protein [Alphaproteobacteria bacterium]MBU2289755.1 DUF421 domain-containing protein [Alphaproteobacteria bacterium]